MKNNIVELFKDEHLVCKIKAKLPFLFRLAELESSRAGKVGMEVGSVREKIIVALLIYKFGKENVDCNMPITAAEVDVQLFKKPISIKTISGKTPSGIKLSWTVDAKRAEEFAQRYSPSCDMLFAHIIWGKEGGFYFIPKEIQVEVLKAMGYDHYIKLPKQGTNPRGVEISLSAMKNLLANENVYKIPIYWKEEKIDFEPFDRWVELWQTD
jgi:hypothetical protein